MAAGSTNLKPDHQAHMNLVIGEPHLDEVRSILKRQLPGLTVWAFGSRVSGRVKRFSDLDLVVVSDRPLPKQSLWEVRESFSDSDLPFRVDVVDLASVPDELRSAVEKNHFIIQD